MIKGNFDIPLDFLSTSTPPLIGVDISSSSIKMVELSEAPKKAGYIIERYTIEALPQDAVSDGNINNLDAVSDAMRRAWKRMGTRRMRIEELSLTEVESIVPLAKEMLIEIGDKKPLNETFFVGTVNSIRFFHT